MYAFNKLSIKYPLQSPEALCEKMHYGRLVFLLLVPNAYVLSKQLSLSMRMRLHSVNCRVIVAAGGWMHQTVRQCCYVTQCNIIISLVATLLLVMAWIYGVPKCSYYSSTKVCCPYRSLGMKSQPFGFNGLRDPLVMKGR